MDFTFAYQTALVRRMQTFLSTREVSATVRKTVRTPLFAVWVTLVRRVESAKTFLVGHGVKLHDLIMPAAAFRAFHEADTPLPLDQLVSEPVARERELKHFHEQQRTPLATRLLCRLMDCTS
jgi:hypothetical protein